ncbi:unnamed protein product [Sphagnum troendelagicum]|uniref:Oleosin n=1 Tax=Sphagnum troendelagicum TaxID=128251 RepID=A0ABP0UCU8_9BRYO
MSSMDQKRDQLKGRAHQLYNQAQQNAPNSRQVLGLVTLLLAGGLLLLLGGLALTGTTITALLATPVLIFFSPILIPLAVVAFFTIGGLLGAGTFGVAVLSVISWAYNYYKGRHPFGADQVDDVRQRLSETASQIKEKAHGYGSEAKEYVQSKTDTSFAA